MAQDQVEVMAALGFKKFMAAGHDRGARVLHRMCLDHPDKVERAAILDIIPQHHLFNNITQAWATLRLALVLHDPARADARERMMSADPDFFITKKLAKTPQGLSFFGKEALEEYKRCFRNPETMHAMCEDYRATATVDLDMDTKDFAAGRKITCPALILWGATGAVGRNHQPAGDLAATTPPTSAAPRRCRAGTTCRKRRRRKPIASCARSFGSKR